MYCDKDKPHPQCPDLSDPTSRWLGRNLRGSIRELPRWWRTESVTTLRRGCGLDCVTERAAVPSLMLRPPIPHVATESLSNSGCKVSQDVSGPVSCSQQGQFDVRLSCPRLHKAGSWKVPRTENSGALSGLRPVCGSLLQIFVAYGFRGVVIVKTLVISKGDFEHMKRSLWMWALKSCLCPVQNSVPSALVLCMYISNYAWIITKVYLGFLESCKTRLGYPGP